MPINHSKIEQRLRKCDKQLNELFADQASEKIKAKIKAVSDYYNLSYTKATTPKTADEIASRYELFVDQLHKVRNNELNSETALKNVKSATSSRTARTLFHNLAKACELMFWAAAAVSCYAGIFGIALPVIIVQPILGIFVGITVIGAMLTAGYKALSCLSEFKTSTRHEIEYAHETSLVSFFNTTSQEQLEDEESHSDLSFCF